MNNSQDIFSKLVDKAKTNTLTEREKRTLFLAVDTYVENNPIYIKDVSSSSFHTPPKKFKYPIKSPFTQNGFQSFVSSWHIHSFKTVIAVFVIMIFGVGGSSMAAQNSLPGNLLYPIKVNLNEGIKKVVLSGPARATYGVELVKTRIDEAKQLVAQNKLTDKIQDELAVRLSSHVLSVEKDVFALAERGDLKEAFEISSFLENSLVENQEVPSIKEIISEPLEASAGVRESTEEKISTLHANDESTKIIAEAKLESTKKLVRSIDTSVGVMDVESVDVSLAAMTAPVSAPAQGAMLTKVATPTSKAKNPDKLAEVRELLAQGEERYAAGEYNDAFSLFKHAYDLAQNFQIQIDLNDVEIENELHEIIDINGAEPTSTPTEAKSPKIDTSKTKKSDYLGELF